MPNILTQSSRRNEEYGYPSTYSPPRNMLSKMAQDIENRRQIGLAQAVATGQIPHDIAYGEESLSPPTVGHVSIDPSDYIGPGLFKMAATKVIPMMAGMTLTKGDDMARLIREAQRQIEAENAAKNLIKYQPDSHRMRNALVGIGAGGAGLAGGYYGADYLSK